jgi:hypothetical protein
MVEADYSEYRVFGLHHMCDYTYHAHIVPAAVLNISGFGRYHMYDHTYYIYGTS